MQLYGLSSKRSLAVVTAVCFTFILAFASLSMAGLLYDTFTKQPWPEGPSSKPLSSTNETLGAVASASDICSRVGIDIISAGGNAIDAAVATEFCLGVTNMWVTGLGAGGFAIVHDPDSKRVECVDFRESAPALASKDMFRADPGLARFGALASGVPGELRGLEYLHRRYATMSWGELIRPAIQIARDGFTVTAPLQRAMRDVVAEKGGDDFFVEDPVWTEDWARNGVRIRAGDILKRRKYADMLESIALHGADVFYRGPIADATIRAIKASGGVMLSSDLQNYSVIVKPAIKIPYREFEIYGCGAPAGGTIALMVMSVMEGYEQVGEPTAINLTTHRLDEVMRFGYAYRTLLGDPLYQSEQKQLEIRALNSSFAEGIRRRISDSHTLPVDAYNPLKLYTSDPHGTSHLSASDVSGLAISLTSTVNLHFGSCLMVPETGLILNNEMDDFSTPGFNNSFGYAPSPANFIIPGKRPLSSMSPIIVRTRFDQRFHLALGAAGGSRIITAVIETLWRVLDFHWEPKCAVAAPRFHDQLTPNQAIFEKSYDGGVITYMRERGHDVKYDTAKVDVHAIRLLANGTFQAAAEPRLEHTGGYAI